MFSLVNRPGWAPVKFDQTGQYSYHWYSTYSCYNVGPTFGGGRDLQVGRSPYNYYSDLGYTYSPPSGYSYRSSFARSFLAGSYQFNPDEVETFYDANFTSQGRLKDKRYYICNFFSGIESKKSTEAISKSCRNKSKHFFIRRSCPEHLLS